MTNGFVSIKISRETYEVLNQMMIEAKYRTIPEYLDYLLREKIAAYKAEKDGISLTDEEKGDIVKRLKELNYM